MGMIIRRKTFKYEDAKNSSEGIFFPEKCCCIMICAYVFVFIAVFYFKKMKGGRNLKNNFSVLPKTQCITFPFEMFYWFLGFTFNTVCILTKSIEIQTFHLEKSWNISTN